MDEIYQRNKDAEKAESPYDTKSKIIIIKSFQATTVFGSLLIHQGSQRSASDDHDVIDITPKDDEGDASDSGLRSMPDDELAALTGFDSQDSTDHISDACTETLHASADKPTQSDPLAHLHKEMCLLYNKVNQLESSITKHVSDSIQSTVPLIVTNTLKEQLPGLLSDALKDTLPQLIKDSIKSSISESIAEELPQVEAQVQKNLQDQLPNILLKPMYKEFNAFNKLESHRFDNIQGQLSTVIKTTLNKSLRLKVRKGMKEVRDKLYFCTSTVDTNSQHIQDLKLMFKDMFSLLEAAKVFKKANVWGRPPLQLVIRGAIISQVIPNAETAPPFNEERLWFLLPLRKRV
ncbi:hypothetical protein Tco_0066277 [Tanacetum coccineum]